MAEIKSDDIKERLKQIDAHDAPTTAQNAMDDAFDRIEALEAALSMIANAPNPVMMPGPHLTSGMRDELALSMLENFRAKARKAMNMDG